MQVDKGPELWRTAKKIIPGGNHLLSKRPELFLLEGWPAYFDRAHGVEVWDLDGNRFIDMTIMGVGTCILGYADPDVNQAVKESIDKSTISTLNSPEEVELAELLLNINRWADMVRYGKTGAEGMSIAVRIARAYSGKEKVAFCGYHGWQDWYLAANLADSRQLDGHLLPGLEPRGVPRSLQGTAIPFAYNDIAVLKEITQDPEVGTVVLEPIRHEDPEPEFLQQVNEICRKKGLVLVVDEITSGFRMNLGGAFTEYELDPDLAVFGKALSNGFALSAVVGRGEVMSAAQDSFISSTYWTERTGCVAALATLKKMAAKNVSSHLIELGTRISQGWIDLAKKHGLEIEVAGIPPLTTYFFADPDARALHTLFTREMLARGYLASKSVYVSWAHTKDIVDEYLDNVDEVFSFIKEKKEGNQVLEELEGKVAHAGFHRLN